MRTLHLTAAGLLLTSLLACGGGGDAHRWESRYDFATTPEAMCARVNDPLELRVCRAEARFRVTRRQGTAAEILCASDRLDEMHAALRERSETKDHHVALANLPGFEADEAARLRRTNETIMRLWDELQAGICRGPGTPSTYARPNASDAQNTETTVSATRKL